MVDSDGFQDDLARLRASTDRLLEQLHDLTDEQVVAPSLLPSWSRGHVITHLARNADAMANLVTWARTGDVTPMYPSAESRDADIETGARQPAAVQLADLRERTALLYPALDELAIDAAAQRRDVALGPLGPASRYVPARAIPSVRRSEIEIHHVDLGLGYRAEDWPEDFAVATVASGTRRRATPLGLAGITALAGPDGTRWSLVAPDSTGPDSAGVGSAGPDRADGERVLHGPTCWLAAWVMGRPVPAGHLTTSDGSAVPPSPSL